MFSSEPVSRLSRQITRCPLASRWSQRCEPRKPAPPVTTQVVIPFDAIGLPRTTPARPDRRFRQTHDLRNLREFREEADDFGGRTSTPPALLPAVFGAAK